MLVLFSLVLSASFWGLWRGNTIPSFVFSFGARGGEAARQTYIEFWKREMNERFLVSLRMDGVEAIGCLGFNGMGRKGKKTV